MMLYGSIRETSKSGRRYVALITDENGLVVASKPSTSREEAGRLIQEAKIQLLKLRIAKRCNKRR